MSEEIYGDSIKLDNGKTVRISKLPANSTITFKGIKIKVADIPLVAARLKCGCVMRAIAVEPKDVIFCDTHKLNSFVVEVIK
jgi:hypothetical protein